MKKYGSRKAKASVREEEVRKMLNMPFCAYLVQISTTFFESSMRPSRRPVELDVGLDELDRAVGAGDTAWVEAPVNQ
jgi:hypothetical protein